MTEYNEKFINIEKKLAITTHLTSNVFPMFKNKRILLRALEEIRNSISECITIILHVEYTRNEIKLYKDPGKNFESFSTCAKKYLIERGEVRAIEEIFRTVKEHKESTMEFLREDKIIILSENMKQNLINLDKIKSFLIVAKKILIKTKNGITRG